LDAAVNGKDDKHVKRDVIGGEQRQLNVTRTENQRLMLPCENINNGTFNDLTNNVMYSTLIGKQNKTHRTAQH